MYTKVFSFSVSLLLNILFLGLLFMGFSFSVKQKELVVINFLETVPEVSDALPAISSSGASERHEEKTFLRREHSSPKARQTEAGDEALLKDRLSTLKARDKNRASQEREEDVDYLRGRLSSLKEGNSNAPRTTQAVTSGVRNEEPSAKTVSSENRLSAEYLFLVRRKLQTHFEIPIYLKNRPGLSALVEIEVRENGEIARITFLRTSADPAFNRAVENCLRAVNPLPVDRAVRLRIEFRSEGIGNIS